MHYFYHFEYDSKTITGSATQAVTVDIQTYITAEKYFVAPLQEYARTRIAELVNEEWHTATLVTAIGEVYGLEDRLKDVLKSNILFAVRTHQELFRDRQKHIDFHHLLSGTVEFAADIAVALAVNEPHDTTMTHYQCPNPSCKAGRKIFAVNKSQVNPHCAYCPYCGGNRHPSSWAQLEAKPHQ